MQETFDSLPLHDYHCALMSEQLPVIVDPLFMVKRGFQWSGVLNLRTMERVVPSLTEADQRPLAVSLEFAVEQGKPCIKGRIQGQAEMICQRCMQPVVVGFDQSFCLGLVETELQEQALPSDWESYYIHDSEIRPADVVEDEVLLALPLAPMHKTVAECSGDFLAPEPDQSAQEENSNEQRPNPFSVLGQLKQSR